MSEKQVIALPEIGFYYVVAKKENELLFFNDEVEMFGSYEKAHLFVFLRLAMERAKSIRERLGILANIAIGDPCEASLTVLEVD